MSEYRNSDELVYLCTEKLSVIIKGSASHPSFFGGEFTEKESSLRVECDESIEVYLSGDSERQYYSNLERAYIEEYRLRPIFFEQQRYEIIIV